MAAGSEAGDRRDLWRLVLDAATRWSFDGAQETRTLTPNEQWLHKQLRLVHLGLASLERSIARQRSRITMLQDGDANTSFFHRQCTYRRQKNRIHTLNVHDRILTDQRDMVEAAFEHFDALLGTPVERDCALDLEQLIEPRDLLDLDAPFGADEIWNAVKRLPARKAPGPDGFTAGFIRACWDIIQHDYVAVFQQLYEMRGRGFGRLNQALLTLIPKRPDASSLGRLSPNKLDTPRGENLRQGSVLATRAKAE